MQFDDIFFGFAFLYPLFMAWVWIAGGLWFYLKRELKQLKVFTPLQVQRLIVTLDVQSEMTEQQWKKYQQIYQTLRKASVQKIGVNNYAVTQGQKIQNYFYQNLSLNDSPLTYRNPYNIGVNK